MTAHSLIDSAAPGRSLDLMRVARSLASSVQHGRHRSATRGGSTEFYEFRPYAPGDPLRFVDWRLMGRSDRLFLRRYRQESQITLILTLDSSESMRYPHETQGTGTKLRRACELAAGLAVLAAQSGDRVGLVFMHGAIAPRSGWPAVHGIVRALERVLEEASRAPATKRSVRKAGSAPNNPLAQSLLDAEHLARRSGVVVAFSDALDEPGPMLRAVARLRFSGGGAFVGPRSTSRRDVVLVQVLSNEEQALVPGAWARLIDPEGGPAIDTDLEEVRDAYRDAIGAHIRAVRSGLLAAGARHVMASLSRSTPDVLRELLGD